ncbi:MAG: hypothetical protein V4709_05315 [Pseudomonadota bacterium]
MKIGSQLLCTKSVGSLQTDNEYYFAGLRPSLSALLVRFYKPDKVWKVQTLEVGAEDFNRYLQDGLVKVHEEQRTLPIWLHPVEGINFDEIENLRYKNKKHSYREIVEGRLNWVSEAADNYTIVLASPNLGKELAAFRKKRGKGINRSRFTLWFWSFFLHGKNRWAVMPPFHLCGTWKRDAEAHRHKKFGRPSLVDSEFTAPSHLTADLSVKGFLKYSGKIKTLVEIHDLTLRKVFKAKSIKTENGGHRYFHPENKPFPSLQQFVYQIIQKLGEHAYLKKLYSAKHLRRHALRGQGSFLNAHLNVLDSLLTDAFTVEQVPLGLAEEGVAELLYCCRGRCGTTGSIVGVGFSLGAEKGEAYRSMLFCCVAPRDVIARVYGIPEKELSAWIARGLSSAYVSDRGGGASVRPDGEGGDFAFSRGEIIPSRDGQGNALVESSHPRDRKLEGHEGRPASKLNVIQLIKQEIFRAILQNESMDVTDRLSSEAVKYFVDEKLVPTPHNFWKYLEDRHCTNSVEMGLDQAVRTFAKKVIFKLSDGGVLLHGRLYSAPELISSTFYRKAPADQTVTGYIIPCSIRVAWIEVEGRLIELSAQSKLRSQDESLQSTADELVDDEQRRKKLKSLARKQSGAVKGYFKEVFEQETGQEWIDNQKTPAGKQTPRAKNSPDKAVIDGPASKGT